VPGRSITYERVENYWARDLPVNVGANNFAKIRFEYFKDPTIAFEAFKAH
jgi:microcin C transport system substrate-binding protein